MVREEESILYMFWFIGDTFSWVSLRDNFYGLELKALLIDEIDQSLFEEFID
jgi:hypothetical protein